MHKIIDGNARNPVFGVYEQQRHRSEAVHPRRLISVFVIGFLEIIVIWLVSLAEETGLSLALSETPKTNEDRFCRVEAHLIIPWYSSVGSCYVRSCQPRVTVTSCFVKKVIRAL